MGIRVNHSQNSPKELSMMFSPCLNFASTVRSPIHLCPFLLLPKALLTQVTWVAHPVSRPAPSENLISLYRLDKAAAGVARKDPTTGEKINKLRKSYEGKVKALQLTGKNKAVSTPDEFTNMLLFPDEEWLNQKVLGKKAEDGFPSNIFCKLDKAVQASPGPLPTKENERWKSIIGTDEPPKSRTASDVVAKKPTQSIHNPSNSQVAPAMTRSVRPERAGKKRSYLDSSFRGYGEGFLDDDPIGSSAGEDENQGGLSKKRRRKMGSGVSLGYRFTFKVLLTCSRNTALVALLVLEIAATALVLV